MKTIYKLTFCESSEFSREVLIYRGQGFLKECLTQDSGKKYANLFFMPEKTQSVLCRKCYCTVLSHN